MSLKDKSSANKNFNHNESSQKTDDISEINNSNDEIFNHDFEKLNTYNKPKNKLKNQPSTKQRYSDIYVKLKSGYGLIDHNITPDESFDILTAKLKKSGLNEKFLPLIEKAYKFSKHHHSNQKRISGEQYIFHPLEVCYILSEITIDVNCLVAGLLHDTIEDTEVSSEDISKEFGDAVLMLVQGLTKIRRVKFSSHQEQLAENFRKMILAMAKDIRVVIIKLCDRLHNMRTIDSMKQTKRYQIAKETLEVYAPLANRLGMFGVKSELEDICLKHLKPSIYEHIAAKVSQKKHDRNNQIKLIIDHLSELFDEMGFSDAEITGRSKHFFSIYKKMQLRKLSFEEIYDLYAFRVVVNSIKDCYAVLGLIHGKWKPQPGRFKDYIAMPKANLYQSLHTTVVGPNGQLLEIQIRTHKMHSVCEFGVASHFEYKETGVLDNQNDVEKFRWLRQMMDWQNEITDSTEFLEALKVDLFEQEIFVFSPKGDVYRLPKGSTSLDFAFAVHSDIGLKTKGAKVNHIIKNLRHKLQNGDVVEIQTSESQKPGKDWLNFVKTSRARSKIRSFLRIEQRQKYKQIGRHLVELALEKEHSSIKNFFKNSKLIDKVTRHYRSSNLDELILSIGYGKVDLEEFIDNIRIHPKEESHAKSPQDSNFQKTNSFSGKLSNKASNKLKNINKSVKDFENTLEQKSAKSKNKIRVSGLDDVLINIAKCCCALPGDDIIGYVTRGRGVSIHQASCPKALDLDPARKISVEWISGQNSTHLAFIRVESRERHGLMAEIASCISGSGVNIVSAKVNLNKDMVGIFNFQISIKSLQQLNALIAKIESIPDIISVSRTK